LARIEGKWAKGKSWLSIAPVAACGGRDATVYQVQFCPGPSGAPASRRFSVVGWLSQHTPIWLLARAFVEARSVVETRIPADLWHLGRSEPAALYLSAHWMLAIVFGNPKQMRVAVRFLVQEGEDPDVFRSVFINASVRAAEEFGTCLEREIMDACPKWWAEHSTPEPDGVK